MNISDFAKCSAGNNPLRQLFAPVMLSIGLVFALLLVESQGLALSHQGKEISESFQLTLKTDKKTYRLGEPIEVTIRLKNVGHESILANYAPRVGSNREGNVRILVRDSTGKLLREDIPSVDLMIVFTPGFDLHEYLERISRVYFPGEFVGFAHSLRRLDVYIEKPGRYKLEAKYRDTDFSEFVEDDVTEDLTGWRMTEKEYKNVLRKLQVSVWSGEVSSAPVWIEILP